MISFIYILFSLFFYQQFLSSHDTNTLDKPSTIQQSQDARNQKNTEEECQPTTSPKAPSNKNLFRKKDAPDTQKPQILVKSSPSTFSLPLIGNHTVLNQFFPHLPPKPKSLLSYQLSKNDNDYNTRGFLVIRKKDAIKTGEENGGENPFDMFYVIAFPQLTVERMKKLAQESGARKNTRQHEGACEVSKVGGMKWTAVFCGGLGLSIYSGSLSNYPRLTCAGLSLPGYFVCQELLNNLSHDSNKHREARKAIEDIWSDHPSFSEDQRRKLKILRHEMIQHFTRHVQNTYIGNAYSNKTMPFLLGKPQNLAWRTKDDTELYARNPLSDSAQQYILKACGLPTEGSALTFIQRLPATSSNYVTTETVLTDFASRNVATIPLASLSSDTNKTPYVIVDGMTPVQFAQTLVRSLPRKLKSTTAVLPPDAFKAWERAATEPQNPQNNPQDKRCPYAITDVVTPCLSVKPRMRIQHPFQDNTPELDGWETTSEMFSWTGPSHQAKLQSPVYKTATPHTSLAWLPSNKPVPRPISPQTLAQLTDQEKAIDPRMAAQMMMANPMLMQRMAGN